MSLVSMRYLLLACIIAIASVNPVWAASGTIEITYPESGQTVEMAEDFKILGSYMLGSDTSNPGCSQTACSSCIMRPWYNADGGIRFYAMYERYLDGSLMYTKEIDGSGVGTYPFNFPFSIQTSVIIANYAMNSTHSITYALKDIYGAYCYPRSNIQYSGEIFAQKTVTFKRVPCLVNASVTADKTLFKPINNEHITFNGTISVSPTNTSTSPPNWSLAIKNASGTTVQAFGGSGTSTVEAWDGRDTTGQIAPSGQYTAILSGSSKNELCTKQATYHFTLCNLPIETISEICDGIDNNCNEQIDEGLSADTDSDGYFTPGSCLTPNDDCDDSDPTIYPGANELCDGKDNNCNGEVDETTFKDADQDGSVVQAGGCTVPGIYDCKDDDPKRFPGNTESCDEKDNNCNGTIDEGCSEGCLTISW